MPAGHGLRARTRDSFSRPFRKKGTIALTTYLRTYRIGDYVDIKVNGAVHKGMPHKFYHGRTGRVWNVTKRAIGVEVNKQVGNRIIRKRIHVRVEHVMPSRCTEEFRLRKIKNDQLKAEAKAKGEVISTKRQPEGPKPVSWLRVLLWRQLLPFHMMSSMTLKAVTSLFFMLVGLRSFFVWDLVLFSLEEPYNLCTQSDSLSFVLFDSKYKDMFLFYSLSMCFTALFLFLSRDLLMMLFIAEHYTHNLTHVRR
ncbi:60S ribosomal protein L21-1 [Spatholobus suberectus]|nr:60S ribosomal protein L21-1 [Spatholobus suberectus]